MPNINITKIEILNAKKIVQLPLPPPLLKVMSASFSFLLIWLVCLTKSTCETRKNIFYFTLKALFVLEIIKFEIFRHSNVMTSSNAQA